MLICCSPSLYIVRETHTLRIFENNKPCEMSLWERVQGRVFCHSRFRANLSNVCLEEAQGPTRSMAEDSIRTAVLAILFQVVPAVKIPPLDGHSRRAVPLAPMGSMGSKDKRPKFRFKK